MDARLVRRLAREARRPLQNAVVRRVVPVVDGVLLVLQASGDDVELGFVLPSGAAWAWMLRRDARPALQAEVGRVLPDLVSPLADLAWRVPDATPLDALRAWLLRPAPLHPGWTRLESARLLAIEPRGTDRALEMAFETEDVLGHCTRSQLFIELFDRAGNCILSDAQGHEILNWKGRPAAVERGSESVEDAAAALRWDPERGAWLDPTGGEGGLSIAAAAHLSLASHAAADLGGQRARALRREASRLARLLEKLDADAGGAQDSERWRALGELLAANQHRVRRGQSRVTVEDFFAGGVQREIELDPNLSPQENVALLFKRARRGARGRDTIETRRESTRAALTTARTALQALPARPDWSAALRAAPDAWGAACPRATVTPLPALWSPGGPDWRAPARERGSEPLAPRGPGRRFVVGGWEIWVGRSNAENDTLTHRFAQPEDVWMHASGVPGSHVVLRMQGRAENPPRDVLESAAAIAARFSKAKHAGTVPVIWTRKRYVRKPRGAKPGLATCTHEKTLFVRPGLPPDAESE